MVNREFENSLDETCFRENLGLLPYSPLAMGLLSGKYLKNRQADGRFNLFPGFGYRYELPNVQEAVKAYVSLAEELGVAPAAMALSFVNDRVFTTSNIIGATNLEQLRENLESASLKLESTVLKKIDDIHTRYPNPAP